MSELLQLQEAKRIAPKQPGAIIHDGLPSYDEAFQKEFFTRKNPRTMNIRSVSVRHEGLNSKVERLNGSIRDREVVMRGMDHKESAQGLVEAMRIYHNYVSTSRIEWKNTCRSERDKDRGSEQMDDFNAER